MSRTIAIAVDESNSPMYSDDMLLVDALESRGVTVRSFIWNKDEVPADAKFVVLRAVFDYIDHPETFTKWMNSLPIGKVLNPAGAVSWNSHKFYLRALESKGVDIIPTVFISRGETMDILAELKARGWEEAVIKPAVSAGARNTVRFSQTEPSAGLEVYNRMNATDDLLLQSFMKNIQTSGECSLVYINGEFSHCVRKFPEPGEFTIQSGTKRESQATTVERELAEKTMNALPFSRTDCLYARVDMVGAGVEQRLMEVELIEPVLYFAWSREAGGVERMVKAIMQRLEESQ